MKKYLKLPAAVAQAIDFNGKWRDPEFISYRYDQKSFNDCVVKNNEAVVSYDVNVLEESMTFNVIHKTKGKIQYTMESGVVYGRPPEYELGVELTPEEFKTWKQE